MSKGIRKDLLTNLSITNNLFLRAWNNSKQEQHYHSVCSLPHLYGELGAYFKNSQENSWPHAPLQMKPTPLETEFNDHLMKITDILSGAKLKNISILDLSAFGSRLVSLRKGQKRYPNWFTEANFAILQKVTGHSNPNYTEF